MLRANLNSFRAPGQDRSAIGAHAALGIRQGRNVMDAVTRRDVLILGRFGDGGLALLQADPLCPDP